MKRMIRWGSPKQYQPGWEKEHVTVPSKLPQPKSKYCKKLKGPHQYGEWKQWISSFTNKPYVGFYQRFCVACNKKMTWMAPDLPGEFWEPDPNARPPIDK